MKTGIFFPEDMYFIELSGKSTIQTYELKRAMLITPTALLRLSLSDVMTRRWFFLYRYLNRNPLSKNKFILTDEFN